MYGYPEQFIPESEIGSGIPVHPAPRDARPRRLLRAEEVTA